MKNADLQAQRRMITDKMKTRFVYDHGFAVDGSRFYSRQLKVFEKA